MVDRHVGERDQLRVAQRHDGAPAAAGHHTAQEIACAGDEAQIQPLLRAADHPQPVRHPGGDATVVVQHVERGQLRGRLGGEPRTVRLVAVGLRHREHPGERARADQVGGEPRLGGGQLDGVGTH
jgi:hypothetical protein